MAEYQTQLYRDFSVSPYGDDLVTKSRFSVFKPESVGTELWTNIVGDDVNNLYHMPHTMEIAERFALYEGLGEVATQKLLTTAITHDWGEAKIGDIPLPDKTSSDEVKEKVAFNEISNELYGGIEGDKLTKVVWSVLGHEDKVTGDMFKAIEYIGYCTTALEARKAADKVSTGLLSVPVERAEKDRLVSGLLGLHQMVMLNNFPTLKAFIEKYPSIEDQLKEM